MKEQDSLILSFVGVKLLTKTNLQNEIMAQMPLKSLRFQNSDDLSISFVVTDKTVEMNQILIEAHKVLESL